MIEDDRRSRYGKGHAPVTLSQSLEGRALHRAASKVLGVSLSALAEEGIRIVVQSLDPETRREIGAEVDRRLGRQLAMFEEDEGEGSA